MKIFTCAADGDRRHQICRCADCGREAECRPDCDFFDGKKVTGDTFLRCQSCWDEALLAYSKRTGLSTITIPRATT